MNWTRVLPLCLMMTLASCLMVKLENTSAMYEHKDFEDVARDYPDFVRFVAERIIELEAIIEGGE